LQAAVFATSIAFAGAAFGLDAQSFIEQGHNKVTGLLKRPKNDARDAEIRTHLATIIDYDEMTKRSFRERWRSDLTPEQRSEVSGLLRQLIERNYRCNLEKTLNYEVNHKGARDVSGEWKVRTEAKNTHNSREPAVKVEYMVREDSGGLKIVDIITENSSLVRNYGDQFETMLTRPDQGWDYLVRKLQRKIQTVTCSNT
jgi:ABC-type transporter MlaC component